MKMTLFLIVLSVCHVQANVYGQGNITLNLQQTSIDKVLNRIEKTAEFRFLYNYDLKALKQKVTVDVKKASIRETLDKILSNTDLTYKLLDNNLIAIVSRTNERQDIRVTGKVTGPNNEPLFGVSVQVKGTAAGTSTNNAGEYSITADEKATLKFTYIGYLDKEVAVNAQNVVNVELAPSDQPLDQVVVVGYGSQRKKDITGAVSTIKASDFENRPIVSAAAGLQGQAAGVNVFASSGKPGWGLTVSVRGNTSLSAKNDPLYVVDGVIVPSIDFINPSDIESFSVLKDASSAAIYGASGANGVVLVTTKKGASGKTKLTVNAYTGFSTFAKRIDVLDRDQYLDLIKSMGYTDPNNNNTDWQDVAFHTGKEQNIQVAASGGTAGNRYYISGGYQKQQGVVAPADYDRYSVRVNLDNKVKDWLNIGTNLSYLRSEFVDITDNAGGARGGTILSTLSSPPTLGIYKPDGTYTSNVNQGSWENPIAMAYGAEQKSVENRVIGNILADFRITSGLNFRSNFGIESQSSRWDKFQDPYMTDYGRSVKGVGYTSSTQRFVWLWENTLNYTKNFGDNTLAVLVGHTMQESDYKYSYAEGRDFPNGAVGTLNAARLRISMPTTMSQWSKRSYLGRINYSYKDKYLLQTNLRYDGSSRFSEDERWGLFPSLSAAWRISNEGFMDNNRVFNDLKLRVGWGQTGNDGIGDYDYYGIFNPNGAGGFTFSNLPKEGLTWEKTEQTNVGIDASFFNNRLSVTIDGYIKKTKDLLVAVEPPPSSGYSAQTYNVGAIENKGIELTVNAVAINSKSVRWNINGNISFNRNKITSLGEFSKSIPYGGVYERDNAILAMPGKALGSFYGYVAEGVDPATGMMKYADLDKSGGLSDGDRTFIGYAQPDFIYGLTNTVSYKNFELNVFFQGIQGNDVFNASRIETEGMYDSKNQSTNVLRRWTSAGQTTDIPRATGGSAGAPAGYDNNYNSIVSSRFIEDGSYLRLKALTLSYKFSNNLIQKAGFSRLNLYVTGQNLFTITNYSGFDPEVSQNNPNGPAMGIDYGTYPQSRTFIFGISADF
ncbi:TonB-dependent receptor [Paraflavitalea sp. CAU 1676]|uniref:TonB-dependent receptor n=1 Tax=Paraflavitalea sp. CAU 1676 TaxID=3032598 RepID=UPI0023D98AE1|nr:TonB-dependent receptor [Paraflavitalea sp. CAU 1676]MDF2186843.1 TonB-dependent receptor [Paraflavitalea sp. CAU 1676]